jgi:hypothetical protein
LITSGALLITSGALLIQSGALSMCCSRFNEEKKVKLRADRKKAEDANAYNYVELEVFQDLALILVCCQGVFSSIKPRILF